MTANDTSDPRGAPSREATSAMSQRVAQTSTSSGDERRRTIVEVCKVRECSVVSCSTLRGVGGALGALGALGTRAPPLVRRPRMRDFSLVRAGPRGAKVAF